MINTKQAIRKIGFIGTLCAGSVLGIVVSAEPGKAQSGANCPQIFYREPFTYQVAAPVGCPPTEFQRQNPGVGGNYPPGAYDGSTLTNPNLPAGAGNPEIPEATTSYPNPNLPASAGASGPVPPLPEEQSAPIANIALADNRVDVVMTNSTGTPVTYQLVGHTDERMLMAGETVSIQNLPVPATITAVRGDGGFLYFEATSSDTGMLNVSLIPEAELDDIQGVMRIQSDGQVFVN